MDLYLPKKGPSPERPVVKPIIRAYHLLSSTHRQALWGLGALMLLSAIFEMAGIASIMPFMSMVADPEIVTHNHWLAIAFHRFGFRSPRSFMISLYRPQSALPGSGRDRLSSLPSSERDHQDRLLHQFLFHLRTGSSGRQTRNDGPIFEI